MYQDNCARISSNKVNEHLILVYINLPMYLGQLFSISINLKNLKNFRGECCFEATALDLTPQFGVGEVEHFNLHQQVYRFNGQESITIVLLDSIGGDFRRSLIFVCIKTILSSCYFLYMLFLNLTHVVYSPRPQLVQAITI